MRYSVINGRDPKPESSPTPVTRVQPKPQMPPGPRTLPACPAAFRSRLGRKQTLMGVPIPRDERQDPPAPAEG